MKIAVIWSDATALVHVGADLERGVAVFDMPQGMAEFIESRQGEYRTVGLAIAAAPKLAGEEK